VREHVQVTSSKLAARDYYETVWCLSVRPSLCRPYSGCYGAKQRIFCSKDARKRSTAESDAEELWKRSAIVRGEDGDDGRQDEGGASHSQPKTPKPSS
jgi:hypothetical protein